MAVNAAGYGTQSTAYESAHRPASSGNGRNSGSGQSAYARSGQGSLLRFIHVGASYRAQHK